MSNICNSFNRQQRSGFTLVEILIVVIIVAILAAIAVPLYLQYVEGARAAEAETAISAIWRANQVYYQRYGSYTASLNDLRNAGLTLEQATLDNWQFSIVGGGDNLTSIQATSTANMPGGAGRTVRFDVETAKFSGYGHGDDTQQ